MKKIQKPKLPPVSSIPVEARDALDQYLTACIAQAQRAEAASRYAAKRDAFDCFKNNAQYWRNGVGILRWLRGQIRRQRKFDEQPRSVGSTPPDRTGGA